MAKSYELAVIGTGVAATTAADRVRAAGWSVAVIDNRPFGGTCALRGCDPKKVLVSAARAVEAGRRMQGRGATGETRIDWPALIRFEHSFTDPVPEEREKRFADQGIDALHGTARFTGPQRLEVDGQAIEARHILLAAGARPAALGIPGEEHLTHSDAFLRLGRLPPRIVMVGGGYIAAEFSHIAAVAGARVTVLQHGERMLTRFDPDLVGWLMQRFRELGIEVRTDAAVQAVERRAGGFAVRSTAGVVEADLVVHAAGRVPDLDALDLDAAGVARDGHGRLRLTPFLQSASNPAVYAAGDAAGSGPPLTPVASHEGEVVAANLLAGNTRRPDYRGVPSVAFTLPPIAAVGLSEAEARAAGKDIRVNSASVPDWSTARRQGESVYGYKVLMEKEGGLILGAHLVGPGAEDTINLFALAIRHGLSAEALKSTLFTYPTAASDLSYML